MRPTILFLDDDNLLLQSMKRMLHKQSDQWDMHFMDNADQAYTLLLSKEFSVIVCDINMPVIDGITFIERCKRAFPYTTRIMLSGNPSMEKAIEAVNRGKIYAYLNKPVDTDALITSLQNGIGQSITLRELQFNASTDSLTGLLNRRQLDLSLEREIVRSRRYHTPLSILMLDIDHFKNVNDQFGHITGDAVLKDVARSIRNTIRQCDICGRFGGEEFLVIFPETDLDTGHFAAERIRQAVEALSFSQKNLHVSISGGLAAIPEDDTIGAIARADRQLYLSKTNGRNQINVEGR